MRRGNSSAHWQSGAQAPRNAGFAERLLDAGLAGAEVGPPPRPRAKHEQAGAVEQGRVVVGTELGVDTADSHPAPLQRISGGDPGARQAEHDGHGRQPRGTAHDGLIPGRT